MLVNNKNFDIGFFYLVFYALWGWLYTNSIFANPIFIYASSLLLFVYFFIRSTKLLQGSIIIPSIGWLWMPYYLLIAFIYFLEFRIATFANSLIAFLILLISYNSNLSSKFPYKLLLYSGLFAFVGILFQMFFPHIYASIVPNIIVYDAIEQWTEGEYGYNGFTYQLGVTAPVLLLSEYVLLYMYQSISWLSKRNWLRILLIGLIIIGVFLTGKRLYSAVAVVLPLVVYYLTRKNIGKQFVALIIVGVLVGSLFYYIQTNAFSLLDSPIFRRLAETYINATEGISISSGRDELWSNAIELFRKNPIFGVGPYEFAKLNGTYVHNNYLQCLVDYGILGFTLFIIPLIYCLLYTISLCKKLNRIDLSGCMLFSLACQLHFIFAGFTANGLIDLLGYMIYILAIGIAIDCKSKLYKNDYRA